jgi:nitrite reductase (NO-forming)
MRKILGLAALAALGLLLAVACGGDATPRPEAAPTAKQPVDLPPLLKATVPPPITRTEPAVVKLELEVKELDARLDDGVGYTYWTYNGSVPGPFVRVRVGDTLELTLKNPQSNSLPHNIDLHAVNGPGGGATLTNARPGEAASFRFKALNPGVYIYHCAFPQIPHHISKGMYGLVLVEPEGGMPPVDKEFYVVQGDIYVDGQRGDKGLRGDSLTKLVSEQADYVVFNGAVGSLMGENALKATAGDTVRIYFGVGGPNVISSFHVIGEVFDRVYPEGALANPHYNVQTTLVPAGGAAMVEFKIDVPGTYLLVDHSLSRLFKGAVGQIVATGPEDPAVFGPVREGPPSGRDH